jgi:hypothetical protein
MHAWADCNSHEHTQHLHRNLPKFAASIQSGRTFLYVLLVKSHYPNASTYLSIEGESYHDFNFLYIFFKYFICD